MKMMKVNKDYMEGLEEERRKIQVFHRELPLCLELVNQAIENCRKQMYYGEERSDCEEQTLSEGPVLEEFLPLKRSRSSSEEEEEQSKRIDDEKFGKKADWLKSVQLWNQNPDPVPTKEDLILPGNKCSMIELKKCGGAFQPFQSEKLITSASRTTTTTAAATSVETRPPSSVQTMTASTSSTCDTNHHGSGEINGTNNKRKKEENKEGDQLRRKSRRCWSPELHKRFLDALQQLGGSHVATPKQIKELMKVDGLTNDEVKSHLQKYRIHTKGPSSPSTTHNDGSPQPPHQFVVVGSIWVPPPGYVRMGEAKEGGTRMTSNGIYVPLAAPPPQQAVSSCSQQQQQQQQQEQQLHQSPTGSLHSEGRSNRGEHSIDVHSNSPTASSSTETTTSFPN